LGGRFSRVLNEKHNERQARLLTKANLVYERLVAAGKGQRKFDCTKALASGEG
jgi:hypothetical protein